MQNFRGDTTDDLALEFQEKVKFRKFLLDTGYDFLDTLYKESLYGFINRNYEVVAPTPDVSLFGDYAPTAEGLTFVTNQFNKFRDHYMQKSDQGGATIPFLIDNLIPRISYQDYEEGYSRFVVAYRALIVEKALRSRETLNFEQFIRFVHSSVFDLNIYNQPATKTGFMLSSKSSVYNTGLYIDMRQNNGSVTDQQRADFISDDGFACYVEFANAFGFYVDGNYPWRLAVNLSSIYTRELLVNGRPTPSFENFYSDTFTMKVGLDDLSAIKNLYELSFTAYKELSGTPVLASSMSQIPTETWLETLLLHRFNELRLMTNQDRTELFTGTLQQTIDIYRRFGLQSNSNSGADGFINKFCAEQLKNKILGQP
jgi:hypothetical protein